MRVVCLLLTSLLLAGCENYSDLYYQPTVTVLPGPAVVSDVSTTDVRDEKPNRYATVRGGYGNPVNVLDSKRPIADEVNDVFTRALQARNMGGGPTAPYRILLTLRTFYGNRYLDENAYIDIDLVLVDRGGQVLYKDSVRDRREEFKFFGDIDRLGKFTEALLNATADKMLDKPAFRAALGGQPARVGAPTS